MKPIIAFAVLALMSGQAISQSSHRDSSLIANKDLVKAAQLIEAGKGCAIDLDEAKRENAFITINNKSLLRSNCYKDSLITFFSSESKAYKSLLVNCTSEYNESVVRSAKRIEGLNETVKSQKRKATWIGLVSAVVISFLAFK